jgi:hypothetical protein
VVTSTWRSLGSINALVDAMFPPLRQHLQVVFMTEHDVAIGDRSHHAGCDGWPTAALRPVLSYLHRLLL